MHDNSVKIGDAGVIKPGGGHSMSLFGPPNVDKLKAKGDVAGLVDALGNAKGKPVAAAQVRTAAVQALVQIGTPAVEPLIVALKDQEEMRARAACEALGQIGDVRAVEPLVASFNGSFSLGPAAAQALGQIGDARALEPLIAAMKGQWPDAGAARALGQIGDPRAVEPLIAALDYDAVRGTAIDALVQIGDAAVEPLVAALKHKDGSIREAAAVALRRLAWTPDSDENKAAYLAAQGQWAKCVEIGTPAVEPLIVARGDADGATRAAAAAALVQIGAPAVGPLVTAYERLPWQKERDDLLVQIGAPPSGRSCPFFRT
jgi:HEAT repeat protein